MPNENKRIEEDNDINMSEDNKNLSQEELLKNKATEILDPAGLEHIFDSVTKRLDILKIEMNKHFDEHSAKNMELLKALNKCMENINEVQVELEAMENTGTASTEGSSNTPAPNNDNNM